MINRDDPLWFKNAVIYEAHVKAFCDSNGDGIGDFNGFAGRLDYLQELGVTAIWLLPFYPSPLKDDGYDIARYRAINEQYGTMRDFTRLVKACHERGMRIITELVVNHTSDQHRWFQRARKARRGSPYRDYYVWSDTEQKYRDARIIFVDTERSNWTWDPVAQQYYWHRFYSHQPDLNFDNPKVVEEVISVMRFWLDKGVDGLRLDAVPYLVERDGTSCENLPETHQAIRQIRAEVDRHYPDRILIAEANQWPEDAATYFGNGDECHMSFHFPLMPRMYVGIAQEDLHPITDIMRQTPDIPANAQWAVFLRNHDELTLEMVTSRERDYLWSFYAADKRKRLNLGIRRRLAPLLDNDRRKIELMNSLLFSMPGTPVIYYGDEIGMGDNVYLGDRDGVRTPMQWSPDRNGGFSRSDPAKLYLPPIMDPIYGYQAVNVEAQVRSPSSLLNWTKRLVSMRQQHKALRTGTLRFLYPGNRKILAYLREFEDEAVLCVANLAHSAQAVELDLSEFKGRVPVELLGRSAFPPIGDLPYLVTLPAYGFHWFVLPVAAEVPHWHLELPPPLPDFITMVVRNSWQGIWNGREARELEASVLPSYLAKQRWFGAKDDRITRTRLVALPEFKSGAVVFLPIQVEVELAASRQSQRYFLPMGVCWEEEAGTTNWPLLPFMVAKVRRGAAVGAFYEVTTTDAFARATLDAFVQDSRFQGPAGTLRFWRSPAQNQVALSSDGAVRKAGSDQSNTSLIVGDKAVLKFYRRLVAGEHPELEMCQFLTEDARYTNTPRLLGAIDYTEADGTPWTLGLIQEYVQTQGDGWTHALAYLDRIFDELRALDPRLERPIPTEQHAIYLEQVRTLGRRIAELHHALAIDTDHDAFTREPITADDMAGWRAASLRQAEAAFAALGKAKAGAPESLAAPINVLVARRQECLDWIHRLTEKTPLAFKTRIHGDLHLGQVLVVKDDFQIIDFEGEPSRSIEERRAKATPLRDVAGMLRSFEYAAWAALFHLTDRDPDGFSKLLPRALEWQHMVQAAFRDSYEKTIAGCPSWPADSGEAARLLNLCLLDKALYEIGYEAASRPSWLRIPVAGLGSVLDTLNRQRETVLDPA